MSASHASSPSERLALVLLWAEVKHHLRLKTPVRTCTGSYTHLHVLQVCCWSCTTRKHIIKTVFHCLRSPTSGRTWMYGTLLSRVFLLHFSHAGIVDRRRAMLVYLSVYHETDMFVYYVKYLSHCIITSLHSFGRRA